MEIRNNVRLHELLRITPTGRCSTVLFSTSRDGLYGIHSWVTSGRHRWTSIPVMLDPTWASIIGRTNTHLIARTLFGPRPVTEHSLGTELFRANRSRQLPQANLSDVYAYGPSVFLEVGMVEGQTISLYSMEPLSSLRAQASCFLPGRLDVWRDRSDPRLVVIACESQFDVADAVLKLAHVFDPPSQSALPS
jgi:hypothetical protein